MKKASVSGKRIVSYFLGLLLVAVGVNVSKMTGLGISPVSSVPRALELIGGFTLGTMMMLVYLVLVLLQLAVLGKRFRLKNVLGLGVSLVFGYLVDLTGIDPNAPGHLLLRFPLPGSYPLKLVYLAAAIVIIAIGVHLYVGADIATMPGEGLAAAIAERTQKAFGDCKTLVDSALICIALLLQLVFLGGFASFTNGNAAVREGTVLLALLTGQAVKLIRRIVR